jgi:hypothetical protein
VRGFRTASLDVLVRRPERCAPGFAAGLVRGEFGSLVSTENLPGVAAVRVQKFTLSRHRDGLDVFQALKADARTPGQEGSTTPNGKNCTLSFPKLLRRP